MAVFHRLGSGVLLDYHVKTKVLGGGDDGIANRVPGAVIGANKGNRVHFRARLLQPVEEGRSVERPGGGGLEEVGLIRIEFIVINTCGVENHPIFFRYRYGAQSWIGSSLVHEVHMMIMDELHG
ncbi:hypothetical protein ES703_101894 [subsurface metagenome]